MSSATPQIGDSAVDGPVPPARSNRRNGMLASCEPCRKRKTRCDHQQPVCGRCRRRGQDRLCIYHPAPLTKRPYWAVSPPTGRSPLRLDAHDGDIRVQNGHPEAAESPGTAFGFSVIPPSSSSVLDPPVGYDNREAHLRSIRTLLTRLRHLTRLRKYLEGFFEHTASGLVPGALIMPAVLDLLDRWNQSRDTAALIHSVAEDVLASTTSPIDVTALNSVSAFCSVHHGKNLRLEILGLIYNIGARSCMYDLYHSDVEREAFVHDMFHCSNEAIRLAHAIVPEITDSLAWLEHENLLLTNPLRGDIGSVTWTRLGQLTGDVLALDAHRESSYAKLPFLMAQSRRKLYAAVFHQDKLLATLMDRPPRISKRYSDCQMPLDLTYDEMLTDDPAEIEKLLKTLTSDGWSLERKFCSSGWARLRFNVAAVREEVLEFPFQPSSPEQIARLKALARQNQEQYTALPVHLQYTPACWDSGIRIPTCFLLTASYLSYRQLDFQIYRLLEKHDADALLSLLLVSEDIITTVMNVGTLRTRASFLAQDFEFVILAYGLPSAAVLATALERNAIPRTPDIPSRLSRSALIRKLTVFVSMLESLQGLVGMRKALCEESSKSISGTLDRVLDAASDLGRSESASTPASQNYYPGVAAGQPVVSGAFGADMGEPGMDALFQSGKDGFELFDLPDWASNVDWANMGGDWMSL